MKTEKKRKRLSNRSDYTIVIRRGTTTLISVCSEEGDKKNNNFNRTVAAKAFEMQRRRIKLTR